MEIKNRYNTDNSSAKNNNFTKLAKYKKQHPKYNCIYAIINDTKPQGQIKIIEHNDIEIKYYSGRCLFEYIFGDNTDIILNTLHNIIDSYIQLHLFKKEMIDCPSLYARLTGTAFPICLYCDATLP